MLTCLVEKTALVDPAALIGPGDNPGSYLEREFEAVREAETVLDILESGRLVDGIWYWDLERREHLYVSDAFWEALGYDPEGRHHTFGNFIDRVYPEDRAAALANLEAHVADASVPFDRTLRVRGASGQTIVLRSRGVAMRQGGVPTRMIGSHTIVGDGRRDDLADKMSEVLTLSNDAIIVWSHCCGVKRWNRGAERLYGITKPAILHRQHHDRLSPVFPVPWTEIQQRVAAGETWCGEVEWTRPDGGRVITETQIQRIAIRCGVTLMLQVDHDITAKVALDRRQQTISRELNHRVKNLFAVIRSLMKLTARNRADVPALVADLDKRIAALAAAHVVSLGHEASDGAPLGEVLAAVLSAYPADPAALVLEGPTLCLAQDHITPMGLILNELATNALKYGAWSVPEGVVAVSWSVVAAEGAFLLTIEWRERRPGFVAPAETMPGFGTQLIELSVRQLGATCHRRFTAEGLFVSLTLEVRASQVA